MSNEVVPYRRGRRFGSWVPELFTKDFDAIWDNFFGDFDRIFDECCYENDEGDVVYNIEVPGFSKENLKVEIADGVLELKGERIAKEGERFAGQRTIHKKITIGDVQDAVANVKDGILTLTLIYPKTDVKKVKVVEVKEEG